MKSCLWGGLGFECDVSGSVVKCLEEERKNLCQSPWNYVNDDPFGDNQTDRLFCTKYFRFYSLQNSFFVRKKHSFLAFEAFISDFDAFKIVNRPKFHTFPTPSRIAIIYERIPVCIFLLSHFSCVYFAALNNFISSFLTDFLRK